MSKNIYPVSMENQLKTINFNNLASGTILTNQYQNRGVTFSLLGGAPVAGPVVVDVGIAYPPASGLGITPGDDTNDPFFDIEISFSQPINYFSILSLDSDESISALGYYEGNLIDSISFPPGSGVQVYQLELGNQNSLQLFDTVILDVTEGVSEDVIGGPEYFDNLVFKTISELTNISISDTRIEEGDRGTNNAIFNVRLSQPTDERVTVSYSTVNGSASSTDFTSKRGTVTFNPRQTRQTIVIPIKGDTAFERDETFSVRLSNASNAGIIDGSATGTIINDDLPLPKISIDDVSLFEGSSGSKTARFTVTLTGKTDESVSLLYSTANGSARAGSDFTAKAGRLTFRPSNRPRQTQTISIPVKGDRIFERNETFTVNLSSATNAEIRDSRGTGTIKNDDDRVVRSSVDFGDSINLLDEAAAYINQYLGSSTFQLQELQQPFTLTSGLINLEPFLG